MISVQGWRKPPPFPSSGNYLPKNLWSDWFLNLSTRRPASTGLLLSSVVTLAHQTSLLEFQLSSLVLYDWLLYSTLILYPLSTMSCPLCSLPVWVSVEVMPPMAIRLLFLQIRPGPFPASFCFTATCFVPALLQVGWCSDVSWYSETPKVLAP